MDAVSVEDATPASAREILHLAVPALGALVAEPLYVLADTAIVGHLGTPELAGLGIASTVLLTGYTAFVFLAYGTTGAVARRMGAGDAAGATHLAVQGLWLALALALTAAAVLWVLGPALVAVLGGEGEMADHALTYLRVSLLGLPALLITMTGTGYLRGVLDARTPLAVAVVTSIANLVVQIVLIEGLGWGIGASALATVLAQTGGAAVYLVKILGPARRLGVGLGPDGPALRHLGAIGWDLFVRTAALRLSFATGTAVAARMGEVPLAAQQIAFEVLTFLALALDALAIAAQSLVGTALGAGRAALARATGGRILRWGTWAGGASAVVLVVVHRPLADLFSDDAAVDALAAHLLLWVAALQIPAGIVFALDGVLIGAGDLRFLARAMVGAAALYVALAGVVLATDAGIDWLWAALAVLFLARLGPLLRRFRRGRWAVLGAEHP